MRAPRTRSLIRLSCSAIDAIAGSGATRVPTCLRYTARLSLRVAISANGTGAARVGVGAGVGATGVSCPPAGEARQRAAARHQSREVRAADIDRGGKFLDF